MRETQYTIRAARKSDCRRIAELYRISSGGVADYIWTKLAQPGEDVLDVGRRRYEREGTTFSYENCKIVELQSSIVGMLVAFPMEVDDGVRGEGPRPGALQRTRGRPKLLYMRDGRGSRAQAARNRESSNGRGREACRNVGFQKLSLIVFEQNVGAKRLYQRAGYVEKRRHPVVPHPFNPLHRGCAPDGQAT